MSYRPIIVIDNSFPQHSPFGFRNSETTKILEHDKRNLAYTIPVTSSDQIAASITGGGIGCSRQDFEHNLTGYAKMYPQLADQVKYLPESMEADTVGIAYLYFLVNTYVMLPYLNKNKIPFVFTLYPGGGFGLNNENTNIMLREIMNSPYFRGVIVTQHVIKDYLIDNNFCTPDKIHFEFGGFSQFSDKDMKTKKYYKEDKDTIDICFVAFKYSQYGKDKGYDIFIDAARQLVERYNFLRFHVVGNFNEHDYDISGLEENIVFYGLQTPDFLRDLYTKMDICVSLSRQNSLLDGGFDGFPLGFESMFFQTVLITTDELNNNQSTYKDAQELVIVKPDVNDLICKIESLIQNPSLLYKIGQAGFEKTNKIMNPKRRSKNIIEFLHKSADLKVSVVCITYNHAGFIRQALDGFVMQKTDFDFEVIVHDDASTDGTADIIREYADKYPDIIKPILQTENQWSRNASIFHDFLWPNIRGKYVAYCEGDDYWTDENKLQKQVDFLDATPDCAVCFHPVIRKWEDNSRPDEIIPSCKDRFNKTCLDINHLRKRNFMATCSVMYRWCLAGCEERFPRGILPGDWYLHMLHAQTGNICMLPDVMGVYRKHAGGIWFGVDGTDDFFIKNGVPFIRFYQHFDKEFDDSHSENIRSLGKQTMDAALRARRYDLLTQLSTEFPELYNEITRMPFGDGSRAYRSYKKYKKLCKVLALCVLVLLVILSFMLTKEIAL